MYARKSASHLALVAMVAATAAALHLLLREPLSATRFVGSQRAASARALSDASVKRQPPSTTFEAGNHDLLGRVGDFGMRHPGRPEWSNASSIEHHFG